MCFVRCVCGPLLLVRLVPRALCHGGVITPREKLFAVKRGIEAITTHAEAQLASQVIMFGTFSWGSHLDFQGKTSSDHALTTDDLLPLLCMTLIKAAPANLVDPSHHAEHEMFCLR